MTQLIHDIQYYLTLVKVSNLTLLTLDWIMPNLHLTIVVIDMQGAACQLSLPICWCTVIQNFKVFLIIKGQFVTCCNVDGGSQLEKFIKM